MNDSIRNPSCSLLTFFINSRVTSGSVFARNSRYLENAVKTSMAATTFACDLSSLSIAAVSFESLSPRLSMRARSPDSLTLSSRVFVARSNFLISSGRVMVFAARVAFQPSAVHHLDIVTLDTPIISAISVCSFPERYRVRARSLLFSSSAFVMSIMILALLLCKSANTWCVLKKSVQPLHRSVQPLHTFLEQRSLTLTFAAKIIIAQTWAIE